MAEIVNLRLARKAFARRKSAELAAENRARHGMGKSEKLALGAETARTSRHLENARRDAPAGDDGQVEG